MSTPDVRAIVPVLATKKLKPVGGIPMLQAVPNDYTMGAYIAKYLQNHDSDDLEFILKAYLPIAAIYTKESAKFFALEPLGANSSKYLLPNPEIPPLPKSILKSQTIDEALEALESTLEWLNGNEILSSEIIAGVIPQEAGRDILTLAEWPDRGAEEPYSIRFPSPLDSSQLISAISELSRRIDELFKLFDHLKSMQIGINETIQGLVEATSGEIEARTERLNQRISHLKKEIDHLSSKIQHVKSNEQYELAKTKDLRNTLEKRKTALERDIRRKDNVENMMMRKIEQTRQLKNSLTERLTQILDSVTKGIELGSSFLVDSNSEVMGEDALLVLLPLIIFGRMEKKRLQIDLLSSALLVEPDDRVGVRRDFVDPFVPLNHQFAAFISKLSERIDEDLSIRRSLIKYSEKHNLLQHKEFRSLLLDGCKLLRSDGLLKESVVDEIDNLLDSIPIVEGYRAETIREVPFRTQDESIATVRFQVQSDTGKPVRDALIELGGLRLRTEKNGVVNIDLPRSHYEGRVIAEGFIERGIEFVLESNQDLVIPIILESLPYEELISQSLDRLVKRTERMDSIQSRLTKAFEKHGSKLVSIPTYRAALSELLADLGYDPESWIAKAKDEGQMMGRLLNKGAKEDAMRRDILRIAEQSRDSGGIILLSELMTRLQKKGWEIDVEQLDSMLSSLSQDGIIEGLSSLEKGARIVKFIPVGLTNDPRKVLSLASRYNGRLSLEQILVDLGWTEERSRNALDLLINRGVAKIQKSYAKSTIYWFPGLMSRKE